MCFNTEIENFHILSTFLQLVYNEKKEAKKKTTKLQKFHKKIPKLLQKLLKNRFQKFWKTQQNKQRLGKCMNHRKYRRTIEKIY